MAYIPNAQDPTEPTESRTVESAALEFRTLKTEHVRGLRFPASDAASNRGELPAAAARLDTVLAFDASTGVPVAGPTITEISNAAANATAAAASAVAAAASEVAAATSEANAAISEFNAEAAANTAASDTINIISSLSFLLDWGLVVNTATEFQDLGSIA